MKTHELQQLSIEQWNGTYNVRNRFYGGNCIGIIEICVRVIVQVIKRTDLGNDVTMKKYSCQYKTTFEILVFNFALNG